MVTSPCGNLASGKQVDPSRRHPRKAILQEPKELHGAQNSQNNLEKEKVGGLSLSHFKTNDKGTLIKTMWDWHNNGHRLMKYN